MTTAVMSDPVVMGKCSADGSGDGICCQQNDTSSTVGSTVGSTSSSKESSVISNANSNGGGNSNSRNSSLMTIPADIQSNNNSSNTGGDTQSPQQIKTISKEECLNWIAKLKSAEYGQSHLVPDGATEEDLLRLTSQVAALDSKYPGGVLKYIQKARKLLCESKDAVNPFQDCTPEVPDGAVLRTGSPEFLRHEEIALKSCHKVAFVIVAGGLGERLGYPGIKLSLPLETFTGMTYLEYYIRCIEAVEDIARQRSEVIPGGAIPLAIMTSDDTHAATLAMLEKNNYFQRPNGTVTLIRQQKVPALRNSDAEFAVRSDDPFCIETKPHGHGDIHLLLQQHDLPKKWLSEKRSHFLILQDTNGLVFHAFLAMLGVSLENDFSMNSLCVGRKPGEAVGAICKLAPTKQVQGSSDSTTAAVESGKLTINVEYNLLSSLLKTSKFGADIVDESTGFSPFPGNTNVLLINLKHYVEILDEHGPVVPEFVNPKYKDAERREFKTPTRLECLMQDLPRLFSSRHRTGVTICDRWLCFSTIKNNPVDAAARIPLGCAPEAPYSAEMDQSVANLRLLRLTSQILKVDQSNIALNDPPTHKEFLGISEPAGPLVFFHPSFGFSISQLRDRLQKLQVLKLSPKSSIYFSGSGLRIVNLDLSGHFTACAPKGQTLEVDVGKVVNDGLEMVEVRRPDGAAASTEEEEATAIYMRGYRLYLRGQQQVGAEVPRCARRGAKGNP